jgi:hypothetical protein
MKEEVQLKMKALAKKLKDNELQRQERLEAALAENERLKEAEAKLKRQIEDLNSRLDGGKGQATIESLKVLFSIVLYYFLLFSIILYYSLLFSIILYYSLLFSTYCY